MVDLAAIGGITSSLKVATDLARGMVGIRDEVKINEKIIELQSTLLDIQRGAIEAQSQIVALSNENRDLKEKLAQRDDWAQEAAKYELRQPCNGLTVYERRQDVEPKEHPHWLCPACFQRGHKGFLQNKGRDVKGRDNIWVCSTCKAEGRGPWNVHPRRQVDEGPEEPRPKTQLSMD